MPKLVEQLQKEAMDGDISVSTLLRKVKLVAVKLKLKPVLGWVELELNGYENDVPDYRKKYGRPKAFNPYHGWIPIHGPPEFINTISAVSIEQSISSLESLLENKGHDTFYIPYSAHHVSILNRMLKVRWADMGRDMGRSQIAEIVERVRTLVLDWALELEQQGILGSEIGFDATEQRRAHEKQVNIHVGSIANFTGSMIADVSGENSRLNVGSKDRSRNSKD